MPQIRFDDKKGLEQKSGSGLVAVPSLELQTLAAGVDAKTINIRETSTSDDTFAVRITTAGATSNVRLQTPKDPNEVGRLLLLINSGTHTITFAEQAASNIRGLAGGDDVLEVGASLLLVWDGSFWSLTSQTLA